jgi:hypothetical protein
MGKSCHLLERFPQFLLPDAAPTLLLGVLTYGMHRVRRNGLFVWDAPAEGSGFALDQATAVTRLLHELVGMFAEAIGQEPKWEGFDDEFRAKFTAADASAEG